MAEAKPGTSADLTCANKDIISSLFEKPFSKRSEVNRNEILIKGRPTPMIHILKKDKLKTRNFHISYYDKHKWLCGSALKMKLFCWPCMLLSTKKGIWNYEGFDDLKNISRSLLRHASLKDHIKCFISYRELSKQAVHESKPPNDTSKLMKINYNNEIRKNREIMKILIDVTSTLCKQELGFRRCNKMEESLNPENFEAVFKLVLNRSEELKDHLEKMEYFRGVSKFIYHDLIECIKEEICDYIRSSVKDAPFYACLVTDAMDISEKSQCCIIIRLVDSGGEIREHFLGFYDENRTATSMFTVVNGVLEQCGLKKKLVAQTYDGASVLAGELNDLLVKVSEVAPQALFTHCCTHRLNLVLQQCCSHIKPVKIFFSILQGIPAFFHQSPKRAAVLESIVGESIGLPAQNEISWNCNAKIISDIHTNRLELIEALNEIIYSLDSSAISIREANGFKSSLQDLNFVFLLTVFENIFQKTELLSNILQKKPYYEEVSWNAVTACIRYMRKIRNEEKFGEFVKCAEISTKPYLATTIKTTQPKNEHTDHSYSLTSNDEVLRTTEVSAITTNALKTKYVDNSTSDDEFSTEVSTNSRLTNAMNTIDLKDEDIKNPSVSNDDFSENSQFTTMKNEYIDNSSISNKQIYYEILDTIVTQLEVRFSNCENLKFLKLGDTSQFLNFSEVIPLDAVDSLMETYGAYFNRSQLRVELEIFFSPQYRDTFHALTVQDLIKKMIENETNQILTEVFKLFCLIATIPTKSSSEESLSCLKRIKFPLRNSMDQCHLSALACISIEKEVLNMLESCDTWYDKIIERFGKKKQGIRLFYQ